MAPLIPNLFTVHHSKEIEELTLVTRGARRAITLFLEGPLKTWAFRGLRGVIGVTNEITKYESRRFPRASVAATYPNGIDVDKIDVADEPAADAPTVHAVFVSTVFYAWQGLDRLLDSLAEIEATTGPPPVVVHLIGELEPSDRALAHQLSARGLVQIHGVLDRESVHQVFSQSQVAIASLALDRKDLREASTLKVREYLASGLPVYSTHVDAGLPQGFPFYYCDDNGFNFARMVDFLAEMPDRGRMTVREAARPHIDKLAIMRSLVAQLGTLNSSAAPKERRGTADARRRGSS
ncbi:hypothetical protein GCM10023171_20880 [Microbacterium panaciterrae]|uniref:Glycosyltransferase n=2 Tax=Microbacterium panaciterrae TaxID=985759 RepID=A0ABP8PDI8_9MICO